MNLTALDWGIVAFVYLFLVGGVLVTKKYMRSVADFLAAGRTAGRYILSVSQGMAAIGAITIIANLEMNFRAGFAMSWWGLSMGLVILVLAVSGWVIYRFRSTRSLTLAEFFERRYSRAFRVFAGLIAFAAGLVNFGIFPSVGARFFIYFTGLPPEFDVAGLTLATYPVTMIVLLATALWFVYAGGQVAVIITDFLQGLFANVVFVVVPVYLLLQVRWDRLAEVLSAAPPGESRINPFDTAYVEDFNLGYFLIGVVGVIYGALSWQGTQAYNTSARSAHEAKMGGVLAMWRGMPQGLLMLLVPILAAIVMQHPDWAGTAGDVREVLGGVENESVAKQLQTPLVLTRLLPAGLIGLFCAMMLAAFISTHDTYLHSWGSIFIQDVIMPFRKQRYTPRQHLRVLRWSILGVAGFIFLFSLVYEPTQAILLYFAITGAIFAGGSGAVIIGGLYWKRGTTGAAWAAMITGSSIAVGGLIVRHFHDDFPINGQQFWGLAMAVSAVVYILVSLLVRPRVFDLDRLLHRGKHAIRSEHVVVEERPGLVWRLFGMGQGFTRRDKALYIATYAWTFLQILVFTVGTIYSLTHDVGNGPWLTYWRIFIWVNVVLSVVVIVWFTVGGVRDVRRMTRALATMERDETDDGMVQREA
jgi:SSS family solute:Na+ symporter